jgi:hypothetical protein
MCRTGSVPKPEPVIWTEQEYLVSAVHSDREFRFVQLPVLGARGAYSVTVRVSVFDLTTWPLTLSYRDACTV